MLRYNKETEGKLSCVYTCGVMGRENTQTGFHIGTTFWFFRKYLQVWMEIDSQQALNSQSCFLLHKPESTDFCWITMGYFPTADARQG